GLKRRLATAHELAHLERPAAHELVAPVRKVREGGLRFGVRLFEEVLWQGQTKLTGEKRVSGDERLVPGGPDRAVVDGLDLIKKAVVRVTKGGQVRVAANHSRE